MSGGLFVLIILVWAVVGLLAAIGLGKAIRVNDTFSDQETSASSGGAIE
ncbi:MAG: hypothetical protein WB402_11745 [Sulfuricaulis sp.]